MFGIDWQNIKNYIKAHLEWDCFVYRKYIFDLTSDIAKVKEKEEIQVEGSI